MSHALQLTTAAATAPARALAARQADSMPLAQLSPTDVGKAFSRLLSRTALLLGHKTWQDENELFVLAASCAETMQRRFPGFKWEEVDEAMKRGASGEYKQKPDEVLYLSLPTVANWLEAYQRTARAFAVAASQPQAALPPSPIEVDYPAQVLALVQQARDSYLPTGFDLDAGNVLYDYLKSIHAFLEPARDADYYADMRAQETDSVLAEGRTSRGAERTAYNTFLAALTQGKLPDNHPLSRSVVNACKKRVLREWLLHHAVEETDMLALLQKFTDLTASHQQAA